MNNVIIRSIPARLMLTTFLAAAVVTATVALTGQTTFAQATASHKWTAGETVEVYALNTSTHVYEWQQGVIKDVMAWGGAHVILNGRPDYIENIGVFDASDADSNPPGINAARYTGYKPGAPTVQDKAKAAGICPCDPGIQNTPKSGASMEVLFKHLIWENYNASVNGTLTSPLKVGVTFTTFKILAPHTNDFGAIGGGARVGTLHGKSRRKDLLRRYPLHALAPVPEYTDTNAVRRALRLFPRKVRRLGVRHGSRSSADRLYALKSHGLPDAFASELISNSRDRSAAPAVAYLRGLE